MQNASPMEHAAQGLRLFNPIMFGVSGEAAADHALGPAAASI
jgi:hypothetical protein